MGRKPCCDKSKVKTGLWSPEEDLKLIRCVQINGYANWKALPKEAGLNRCGKSCRMRWVNYLRPDLKRGDFTREEEEAIIKLHKELGNKWSKIASHFPGRTDNEIKNVWNTQLKKRLSNNDHYYYNPTHKMKENYIATSSSSFTSILCPGGRQEIRESIGMVNQENGVMNEISLDYFSNPINPNLSNVGTNQMENHDFLIDAPYQENIEVLLNPNLTNGCTNQMGTQDFLIDGPYQENNEVFMNPNLTNVGTNQMGNQDFLIDGPYQENNEVFSNLYEDDITEFLNVPIDNEFWENLLKEDQVGSSLSQRKEEEIRQNDREEEDKSMEWLKNWENDLLGDL